ncbi:uncharacterized protein F4807DRAFT_399006 [Annulohypoxylon truncatum]|uniref:uncharacterized protein n=1 Tax=Annulohypoxylon truncatum TaxID=327061 RepID=UPI0020072B27|nr:uncharacterized protein F4807DRAFT_399006 [Annulohypoxylon truncatum]KAI1211703.1 hypothetical protein F4807DRAFT_399006 [Annulohypoxylon truncatum]
MHLQSVRTLTSSGLKRAPAVARSLSTTMARMSDTDKSHATGKSKVPKKVQEKVPKDLEDTIPDSVSSPSFPQDHFIAEITNNRFKIHPTGKGSGESTSKTHAKGGGEESVLPKKVQEKVPESIERAVPNSLHNTGDK